MRMLSGPVQFLCGLLGAEHMLAGEPAAGVSTLSYRLGCCKDRVLLMKEISGVALFSCQLGLEKRLRLIFCVILRQTLSSVNLG